MPDRAIIPLFAAVATGFIGGTIGAVTQTFSPGSVIIGLVLGALVFGSGFVSVIKAPGEESERWIVGAMRGACASPRWDASEDASRFTGLCWSRPTRLTCPPRAVGVNRPVWATYDEMPSACA